MSSPSRSSFSFAVGLSRFGLFATRRRLWFGFSRLPSKFLAMLLFLFVAMPNPSAFSASLCRGFLVGKFFGDDSVRI